MLVTKYQKIVIALIVLTGVCSGFDIGVISGPLMDIFSRKNILAFGAFLFTVSMILMMVSNTYTTLMLSRLLQGVSIGFLLTVIPVYISETSVAKFRGRAMAIFQLSLVSGIFLANFFASLFVASFG